MSGPRQVLNRLRQIEQQYMLLPGDIPEALMGTWCKNMRWLVQELRKRVQREIRTERTLSYATMNLTPEEKARMVELAKLPQRIDTPSQVPEFPPVWPSNDEGVCP